MLPLTCTVHQILRSRARADLRLQGTPHLLHPRMYTHASSCTPHLHPHRHLALRHTGQSSPQLSHRCPLACICSLCLELALQLGIFGAEVLKGARARAKRALLLGQFIREDAKGDFIIVQLVEGLVDLLEEQLVRAEQRVADACRAKCVCST